MNRFYSINLNKEKWSNVNENIWFYPTKRDYKYRIPIEEIPYFLFWLSKSKNLRDYFKNIAFEFDLTKYGIYFGYFKSNLNPEDYPKTMYNKYQKQNYHNKKIILKTLINSFDCDYILMLYESNNLNLYFPLSREIVLKLDGISGEIIYENMFYENFRYSPSILKYLKKHGARDFAQKLDKKRYKNEHRRLQCNLGNKRGSKFDLEWRAYCKKRDNYTCQCCGSRKNLEVHHINGYHKYPSLRTAKSNGVVLCRKCHKLYHSEYGMYANADDFREFMLYFSNKNM